MIPQGIAASADQNVLVGYLVPAEFMGDGPALGLARAAANASGRIVRAHVRDVGWIRFDLGPRGRGWWFGPRTGTCCHKLIEPASQRLPPRAIGVALPGRAGHAPEFGPDFGERHRGDGFLTGHDFSPRLWCHSSRKSICFAMRRESAFLCQSAEIIV